MLSSNNRSQNSVTKIDIVTFCCFLSISKHIDLFSILLTILAAIVALIHISLTSLTISCLIIFILGLMSKYYAIRIDFDRKLFEYLSEHVDHLPEELLAMDIALANLQLIKPHQSSRTLSERQKGILSLFKRQVVLFLLQNCLIVFIMINAIITS
ncbi:MULTISPECIES: hypothetical protein [Gilliamella]|uniref:Uncharacterized protein n=1 Tax=Gilliamella apis TaxID=1970738 RepID=A0A2V4DWC0_9GAMM|nr:MULTISPECIES: hypothetical protein [Gilliamella]MBI0036692.1 hypothetical protein [Gilliamella sp. B14384G10]MBI0040697.1 hypothetical protein [Gilliamella sp. B14384G7]MBI0050687.1 hypothetical protein [Gilliamella sp. B14384G13]MBI0052979.1 hypothetical protein [Gilliamella sp. B14384H2]MBI0103227.1 hypothetical protein [Gilliamella sp. W8145]